MRCSERWDCSDGGGPPASLAHHGPLPTLSAGIHLTRGSVIGRAIIDKRTIHVTDLQAQKQEYPEGSELAGKLGHGTIVAIPLVRLGEAIGAIAIRRADVRPFNDGQIQLLKTFADRLSSRSKTHSCSRRCRHVRVS